MSELFNNFTIIMDAANNYKQNPNLYYTLKDYIFRKIYFILSKDNNCMNEKEKATFINALNEYKVESKSYNQSNLLSKDDYITFLEKFYSKLDFNSINPYMLAVCRDLTEVLEMYGTIDELFIKRSNKLLLN
jgi:hypothetical protein